MRRLGLVSGLGLVVALAVAGATFAQAEAGAGGGSSTDVRVLNDQPRAIFIGGAANKSCDDLDDQVEGASWSELKIDSGALPGVGDTASASNSYLAVTLTRTDTDTWSWTSTKGVDAVFVKSGVSGSNLYVYDPPSEATSGEGLTVPGTNGTSHVSFCYDEEAELSDLTIQKTGAGTYDLQHSWSIDKQVKRGGSGDQNYADELVLSGVADGGSRIVTWRVVVTHLGATEANHAVTGSITVSNPNGVAVSGVSVGDPLPGAIVDCSSPTARRPVA